MTRESAGQRLLEKIQEVAESVNYGAFLKSRRPYFNAVAQEGHVCALTADGKSALLVPVEEFRAFYKEAGQDFSVLPRVGSKELRDSLSPRIFEEVFNRDGIWVLKSHKTEIAVLIGKTYLEGLIAGDMAFPDIQTDWDLLRQVMERYKLTPGDAMKIIEDRCRSHSPDPAPC